MLSLRIVGLADGRPYPNFDGKYIAEVGDIDNINTWLLTNNIAEAKVFEDHITAIAFYKWQSSLTPMRPDGKPNRPLTAFTVVFENV